MNPHVLLILQSRFEESAGLLKGIIHFQRTQQQPWSTIMLDDGRSEVDPVWVRSRKWDGIISAHTTPELVQICAKLRVPLVDLGDAAGLPDADRIAPDNNAVGRAGADYFVERKFRHFGFCGFANLAWSCERRDGFVTALSRAGHRCEVFEVEQPKELTPAWEEKQAALLAAWLRCLPAGTAVMGCSDFRAQQIIRSAQVAGLAVPQEVAVLGANNNTMQCELTDPAISSVAIDTFEAGRRAAEHLARRMAGEKTGALNVRIPPLGVVPRKSTDVLAKRDRNVATALEYIRDHACENITVDQVLEQVHLSRSQLEHKFRRYVGHSPQVEIRKVQVARICQLLTETNLPLKDIADRTGFVHVEYMCVVFKRVTGGTPGQYRQRSSQASEHPWPIAANQ